MQEFGDSNPSWQIAPSLQDQNYLKLLRSNINIFLDRVGTQYGRSGKILLDIAPQDHDGARPHFDTSTTIHTLDINPLSGATYIADLCDLSAEIPSSMYDYIVCTEVLEHTLQPFNAVSNMKRLLKPGGILFVSTPFNFRIHGPLPDCWRFTENGLRILFNEFEILELFSLETEERPLMPIQYTLVAQKSPQATTCNVK